MSSATEYNVGVCIHYLLFWFDDGEEFFSNLNEYYHTLNHDDHAPRAITSVEFDFTRPGLGQIADTKFWGHSEVKKKETTERSGCGCIGHGDKGHKLARSWTQHKTLKYCFLCHIYCARLETDWYQVVGADSAVSNRETRKLAEQPVPWHGIEILIGIMKLLLYGSFQLKIWKEP